MVARSRHGLRRVLEQRFTVVLDKAGFSVHELMREDNVAAKSGANRLMSQAYTQHRTLAGKVLDQINADARSLRRAGAGRNQNVAGSHLFDSLRRDLVVAPDFNFLTQL